MNLLRAAVPAAIAALLLAGCSDSASTETGQPASSGAPAAGQSAAGGVRTVGAQEWLAGAGSGDGQVIDVRTPAEYAAGHVSGAVNIDVESPDFTAQLAELDKSGTYYVYCRSGRRSGIATQQMADAGFVSVVNLEGGLADLQAAGAEVIGGTDSGTRYRRSSPPVPGPSAS